MFASTCYFLKAIDVQERIVVSYQAEQYEKQHPNKINLAEIFNDATTYTDSINAKQKIKEFYRYMLAIDAILFISIIVISKSFNKAQAKE